MKRPIASRRAYFRRLATPALLAVLSLLAQAAWAQATPAPVVAPSSYDLSGDLDATSFYDDNVTRAQDGNTGDALGDYVGKASGRFGGNFWVAPLRTKFLLQLSLQGQFYANFNGLTHFAGLVDFYSGTNLWNGGLLSLYAEASKEAYQQKLRNALTYDGSLELTETVHTGGPGHLFPVWTFSVWGSLDGQTADNRPGVGSSVVDGSGRTVALSVAVEPGEVGLFEATVTHRDGTLVSSTRTPGPFATVATESVADPAFGNGFTSYRYTGVTNTIEASYDHRLSGDSQLRATYQRIMISASSTVDVTADVFRLSYSYHF